MRNIFTKSASVVAGAMLLLSSAASLAHAHATILWCYVEKGRVYVEGSFMGNGKTVQNGKVLVVNDKGDKVLEGTTDKEGKFNFAPPYRGKMTIVLKVDQAHDAEFELTEQDFAEAENEDKAAETESSDKAEAKPAAEPAK